jgi:hypothetical protein
MTMIKVLSADEWDILKEADDHFAFDPSMSLAVAAIDPAGHLCGRTFIVNIPHLEGFWLRSDTRNGTVGHSLELRAVQELRDHDARKVFAYAVNSEIEGYLRRLGYSKLNFTIWQKEI